jgi:hypothetical protein
MPHGLVLRLAPSCTLHTICISRLKIVFISKKKLEQKLFFETTKDKILLPWCTLCYVHQERTSSPEL